MKAKGFVELKGLREQLAQDALEKAKAAALAKEKAERLAREVSVFRDAMTGTEPLRVNARVDVAPPKPEPIAFQFQRDEQAALWQTLSDDMDIERLLDTDANLSFRRSGIGEDVTRKLRKGHWAVQDQIDLHGLRTEQAREALGEFFSNAHKRELRCLRVIHGKGLGSVNKTPVLKDKVLRWLVQRDEIIAFCQARPNDGGAGALIVLLGRVV